jgi:hypothetical protein
MLSATVTPSPLAKKRQLSAIGEKSNSMIFAASVRR